MSKLMYLHRLDIGSLADWLNTVTVLITSASHSRSSTHHLASAWLEQSRWRFTPLPDSPLLYERLCHRACRHLGGPWTSRTVFWYYFLFPSMKSKLAQLLDARLYILTSIWFRTLSWQEHIFDQQSGSTYVASKSGG